MPSPRRPSLDDTLAVVIVGLEALQATSTLVGTLPLLNSVVGGALGLARAVNKISYDRERYLRLARRAADLSVHIEESLCAERAVLDEALQLSLVELAVLLDRIRGDVEKELRRKPLSRFLRQSSIATTLDDHLDALDSAWRAFDTASLIALRAKMERQAVYDDCSQLRLFRWSDLRCLKVRGTHRVGRVDAGREYEAKYDGRAVVVRTIRPPRESQRDYASLVTHYPDIHHPYLAQVIGHSHPAIPERFYVIDAGVLPIMHQFRGKDVQSRVIHWLQHIVDYQDAFRYLQEKGFSANENHCHDGCLPSAMLNEEGRLILDASDFCDSSLGCFQYRLRLLYDEDHEAVSPGDDFADDTDVASDASALLSALQSSIRSTNKTTSVDVEPFLDSRLAIIWASHRFQGDVNANWGDYGYLKWDDRGGQQKFVRLGHLYDLVQPTGKLSTFILKRLAGSEWMPAEDHPWADDEVCHSFSIDPSGDDASAHLEEIAAVRTIPDDWEYHDFFWNHAEGVAQEHGISLHEIILFEETFHYACLTVLHTDEDESPPTQNDNIAAAKDLPTTVYFHQRPRLATGEAASPWGYWSLDVDPTPGPWPSIDVPGVSLTCRVTHNYARLSTFEAEFLAYMNRLRRNGQLIEPH